MACGRGGSAVADVQTEHGYMKLANDLDEALTYAPFRGLSQAKIARAIVRMTFGWGRKTVRISTTELAERCNERYSGAFQRALRQLIDEGVVWEVEKGAGRRSSLFAVNKNYEEWGRFSVAARTLDRLFKVRLPSDDTALSRFNLSPSKGCATIEENATDDAPPAHPSKGEQVDFVAHPHEGEHAGDPENDSHLPEGEQQKLASLPEGENVGRNSIFDETLQRRKDSTTKDSVVGTGEKDHITKQATTPSPAGVGTVAQSPDSESTPVREYAIALSTAVNAGIAQRWGEQPTLVKYGTGLQLATLLIARGVPVEDARTTIAEACQRSKKDRPPNTIEWFRNPILEAIDEARQRALNAASTPPVTRQLPGNQSAPMPRTPAQRAADQARERIAEQERARLERLYTDELAKVSRSWRADNLDRYLEISEVVENEIPATSNPEFRKTVIEQTILLRCAKEIGFPDLETWLSERRGGRPPPPEVSPNPGVTVPSD
jgi:phage replication O-like protein O